MPVSTKCIDISGASKRKSAFKVVKLRKIHLKSIKKINSSSDNRQISR